MKLKLLLIVAVMALFGVVNAYADVDVGANVDYNRFKDAGQGDWGVGGRIGFGDAGVMLVTSFDYYFVDAGDLFNDSDTTAHDFNLKFWELNENITYTLPTQAVKPYFGAGVGVARRTFKNIDLTNDKANKVGFNVLGGVKFGGAASFFLEARGTFYSGEDFRDRFIFSGGFLF
jgi:opacity protein-like surface antigen